MNNEIPCQKYNYSLDKSSQNRDHYFATLKLSKDGNFLVLTNLKPEAYKEIDSQHLHRNPALEIPDKPDENKTSEQEERKMSKIELKLKRSEERKKSETAQKKRESTYQDGIMRQLKLKSWDERLQFSKHLSRASCKISDIKYFIFGGTTSRFWLLRKHINSMDLRKAE